MKSEWRVWANPIGGKMMYGAYRLRDKDATDHSGNRESAGRWYDERETAEELVRTLNEEEKE